MKAEISGGVYSLPSMSTLTSSLGPPTILYGTSFSSAWTSLWRRPIKRLIEYTVRLGLVMACRLAGSPTKISPLSVKATTLGVRRLPSWLGMTLTSLPSMTATTELVVPRSMPMIFSSAMCLFSFLCGEAHGGAFREHKEQLQCRYDLAPIWMSQGSQG